MSESKLEYICLLHGGCSGNGHSLSCQQKNKEYAEAWRVREGKRRLALMDAVIRGDKDGAADDVSR